MAYLWELHDVRLQGLPRLTERCQREHQEHLTAFKRKPLAGTSKPQRTALSMQCYS